MSRKSKLAAIEERRKKVAVNLLAGLTYRQMAEALDVSVGTIASDVKIILGRWRREQVQTVDDYVTLQMRRFERAVHAVWKPVTDGDQRAIQTFLQIHDRMERLVGMNKPLKVAPTDPSGTEAYEPGGLTDEQRIADVLALLEAARARAAQGPPGGAAGGPAGLPAVDPGPSSDTG
jgi:hypothetical protein